MTFPGFTYKIKTRNLQFCLPPPPLKAVREGRKAEEGCHLASWSPVQGPFSFKITFFPMGCRYGLYRGQVNCSRDIMAF